MTDLTLWAPLLLSAGALVALFELLGAKSASARIAASAICAALTLRYMYWRCLFTLPVHQNMLQSAWSRLFLIVELGTLTSSLLVYLFMSRTISRSSEADEHQGSWAHSQPVDVFIATYNESRDILERTLVGALAIEHPDLRVWVAPNDIASSRTHARFPSSMLNTPRA